MVKSYTALRTHISLVYHTKCTLVRGAKNGLLVKGMKREECRAEDTVCYGCEQLETGILFSLDTLGIQPRARQTRFLPTTYNTFLSRCLKDNIEIKKTSQHQQTTPQLLSSKLNGDLVINDTSACYLANYATVDIVLKPADEIRLSKLNYVKSSKTEGAFRVILKTSSTLNIRTEDLLLLLEEVVKGEWEKEGWSWKGWDKEGVEKIVKEGMSVMLFAEADKSLEQEGVW